MAVPMENNLEIGDLRKVTTYQAGALQAAAYRAIRLLCDSILSPYGITERQWLVAGLVLDAGGQGMRLAEIGRKLDLTPSSLNSIIKTLEARHMVVWLNKQGSQKVIAIHPAFAQDCPEIERVFRSAMRSLVYTSITPLELRIYLKVLYQLSQLKTGDAD